MHYSVMAAESLGLLAVRPDGGFGDATNGLGGHTALIAQRLTTGLVIANDRDELSLAMARENTREWAGRIRFHHGAFQDLAEALAQAGFEKADGLLADLGVSRYQLTAAERGFSFLSDGALDMRMDQTVGTTAADLVNHTSEGALADLIFQLGEERRSRRIARAIVRARPIKTTGQLAKLIESAVPRAGTLHPATQTFMALRIAVNQENEELDALLAAIPTLVKPGGRAVLLTFMSLEDRKVKQSFQALARDGRVNILTRHVVRPSEEEIRDKT